MRAISTSWSIRYSLADGAAERRVTVDKAGIARPADYARELGLVVRRREGEGFMTKRATICPTTPVDVTSISVALLDVDVLGADAIFLSGYNSWTHSVERHPLARIRGLNAVPTAVVNRWVLDNSGDYRFVPQSGLPGNQHGVGYGYLRYGINTLMVGSLNEDSGYTVVRESARGNALKLEKEPPAHTIQPGEEVEIISFAITEGAVNEAFSCYASLMGVSAREAPPLVGYSSWYRHYGNISHEKLMADLEGTAKLFAGRDIKPCEAVFQVDDGYTLVGDWTSPDSARFPEGMAGFPQRCHEAGLVPGLWLAPFLVEKESKVAAEHPDWLLRDEAGELVSAAGNWSGAWALDTRNPEVREHIKSFMSIVTRDWGYRLLKLDFLFGACLLPHDGMNRGELMADALDLLRASVPDDTWFDLCGVPLMSAFGRTEYCRIGCDVSLDWNGGALYTRLLHRERISTKRSLDNTLGRAHLDGVVFRNDPDVFFLRDDVYLSESQKRQLLMADVTFGGMLLTSDSVEDWTEEERAQFEEALRTFVNRHR